MRSFRTVALAAGVALGALAAVPPVAQASVDHGSASQPRGHLTGVVAISPTNVWAVGYATTGQALIEHNDGTGWSQVPYPDPGGPSALYAISAVSAEDIWAVGEVTVGSRKSFILHYDGTDWTQVASPGGSLRGVSADTPTDAWAVGPGDRDPLIEHWNGTAWSIVVDHNPHWASRDLVAVTATAPDNAWAVGYGYVDEEAANLPLTEHWNGSAWRVIHAEHRDRFSSHYLRAVSVAASHDIWAVGDRQASYQHEVSMTEHWDGQHWALLKSPNPGVEVGTHVLGVSAQSTSDVWAVGDYYNGERYKTLAMHWDGAAWAKVSSVSPGQLKGSYLTAVSADAPDDAWAVGYFNHGRRPQILIEHWDGSHWSRS